VCGYARVSTRDQDLAGQIAERAAGCGNIFKEKVGSERTPVNSGSSSEFAKPPWAALMHAFDR
jgi:hypothetical protein